MTDILDVMGPVAFVQHIRGPKMWYEPICPWCAETLTSKIEAVGYGELYMKMLALQEDHMRGCSRRTSSTMQVETGLGAVYGTSGGVEISDKLANELADEAERGYDLGKIREGHLKKKT